MVLFWKGCTSKKEIDFFENLAQKVWISWKTVKHINFLQKLDKLGATLQLFFEDSSVVHKSQLTSFYFQYQKNPYSNS